jgi:prepilin-type N-terminal cleavage/methylation domain-containing protein
MTQSEERRMQRPMTDNNQQIQLPPVIRGRRPAGFTLIEMLVVIAIIGVLASLLFPVGAAVKNAQIRKSAVTQMEQIQTAITEYKSKLGYYPPDNPVPLGATTNYALNQLYYELVGTVLTNNTYQTLNGATTLSATAFPTAFGTASSFTSFANTTKNANSDDVQSAANFLKNIKGGQFLLATKNLPGTANGPVMILGNSALKGPNMYSDNSGNSINPWYYNSSNPTNNTTTFDLWIDVKVGQKTNRICNWSAQPIVL